ASRGGHCRHRRQVPETSPVRVQGLASSDRRRQGCSRMKKKKAGKLPSRREKRVDQCHENRETDDPPQPRLARQIIARTRIPRDPRSRQAVRGGRQAGKRGTRPLDLAKKVVVARAGKIGSDPSFPEPE